MSFTSQIQQRILGLRAELDALLVDLGAPTAPVAAQPTAPTPVVAPAAAAPAAPAPIVAPAAPTGPGIDVIRAAELLDVARATVDARIKAGKFTADGPVNVSKGAVRARWVWADGTAAKRWWAAVK